MSERDSPCRLFVYLAREAPVAVVLRRGPSDWARLSLWRTDSDEFDHGQWLRGRVYERRCDVSADGSLFVAFVRQSGGRNLETPAHDTWLAVSRVPYFTALALWFVGGTYHTGGFFPERDCLWTGYMEQAADIGETPSWLRLRAPRDIPYIDRTPEWTDRTVHFNRLLRDGWEMLETEPAGSLWRRPHPRERGSLYMMQSWAGFDAYGGPYRVEYSLRDDQGGEEVSLGEATWADFDQQGYLVLARDGQLWRYGPLGPRVLEDFNQQAPDPRPAPDWAKRWPDAPT